MEPVIFHVDLDAFYASVEEHDNPELKDKAVIIGALPGHRGVVSACSYAARRFGVRSAMPISEAYRRCPDGVYLRPRMERYHEVSLRIMEIFADFSPLVQQISVDEAFLDMSGTRRLYGTPIQAAEKLKAEVRRQTGLSVSIGIAWNKYLAKLASDFRKPDGMYQVVKGEEEAFLDQLPLKDLWGLGAKGRQRLEELNIRDIPSLRMYPLGILKRQLGAGAAEFLWDAVHGRDPGIFSQEPKSRSLSTETTFGRDTADEEGLKASLLDLSHQVMFRMMREGFTGKTVVLKLRFADFSTTTAQTTLVSPVVSAEELYGEVLKLFSKRWSKGREVRLIGVGLSNIEPAHAAMQGDLFEDPQNRKKRVEEAVVMIRDRHTEDALVKARLLHPKKRT
ncbi:DNA polymerase IV [Marispirochaeta aestuarii]|uniref:DNA polymerase IV n=1 Tax=Marispirochaeta aestuarii TaxID=1963862 RepID=UPI0029C9355E|nr:DNA polymerase IV [Marispirochaeta aestuarii]